MLYNNYTVATLATRTQPKGIAMIVSKKITAAALLGVITAGATALVKVFRSGTSQKVDEEVTSVADIDTDADPDWSAPIPYWG